MWSRFRSVSAISALLLCSFAFADAEGGLLHLQGGKSPDGRLALELQSESTKSGGTVLSYVVLDLKTARSLLKLESSYTVKSPEPGEVPDHWLDLAKSADVYWTGDSSLVAIDEYPLQHSGHVFLVAIDRDHRARRLSVPEAEIIRRTGFDWARVRIRVCKERASAGWIDSHHLCLTVGGYPSHPIGEAALAGGLPNMVFRAVLEIDRHFNVQVGSVAPESGSPL